jgi:hypothetical protein
MALFKRKPKAEKVKGEKQGQMKVLKDASALVRKHQPIAFLWMALSFIAVMSIGIILGLQFDHPVYFSIISHFFLHSSSLLDRPTLRLFYLSKINLAQALRS